MAYSPDEIEDIFCDIIDEIIEGRSLRDILKDNGMPRAGTFFKWLDGDSEKNTQYGRACELRADFLFEKALSIAENTENGTETTVDHNGVKIVTKDMLGHRKLKIDTINWHLTKMNPKKYGNKIDVTSDNEKLESKPAVWNFIDATKKE